MFLEKVFWKYAVNFRILLPKNPSAGQLLIFSEFLAPEITRSNDVQIHQFMLIGWNQTCFSHGHIASIHITHLTCNLVSKKMQMSHMDLKKFGDKSYKGS